MTKTFGWVGREPGMGRVCEQGPTGDARRRVLGSRCRLHTPTGGTWHVQVHAALTS